MTRSFLNLFFRGSQDNYRHWSATLILCLSAATILPVWAALLVGVGMMGAVETCQYLWCSGWNWTDVLYNIYGGATFLVISGLQHLVHL